jgi:dynein heavy chain
VWSSAPSFELGVKWIVFMKRAHASKLSKETMDRDVVYSDCGAQPMGCLQVVITEMLLPLLSKADERKSGNLSEIMEKLVGTIEVTRGRQEGKLVLPIVIPSMVTESQSERTVYSSETALISWMKQIKNILKVNPMEEVRKTASHPGPQAEYDLWYSRHDLLQSVESQLISSDIQEMHQVSSVYVQPLEHLRREVAKALLEAEENIQFLKTLAPWIKQLNSPFDPLHMIGVLPPLLNALSLVWQHSRYYHVPHNLHRLLLLVTNQVIMRAQSLVNKDIFLYPDEVYQSIKNILRIFADFRGSYLDQKTKADQLNAQYEGQMKEDKFGPNHSQQSINENTMSVLSSPIHKSPLCLSSWSSSPWPQWSSEIFVRLNGLTQRCIDVLDLVQTMQHFGQLEVAAQCGGMGLGSLDGLIQDIHEQFMIALGKLKQFSLTALDVDEPSGFEEQFFSFRSTIKKLEEQLAVVLEHSLDVCPTTGSQLQLLEVFQGISSREFVQTTLHSQCSSLVLSLVNEMKELTETFHCQTTKPLFGQGLPPVFSIVLWLYGLKQRALQPLEHLKAISLSILLESDNGKALEQLQAQLLTDLALCETRTVNEWKLGIATQIKNSINKPLLKLSDLSKSGFSLVEVNLNTDLTVAVREAYYLSMPPLCASLPETVQSLVNSISLPQIWSNAVKLEAIANKHNEIIDGMSDIEKQLFEAKLVKMETIIENSTTTVSWTSADISDFVEDAKSFFYEFHSELSDIRNYKEEIQSTVCTWFKGSPLDEFTAKSYRLPDVVGNMREKHMKYMEQYQDMITVSGQKIHTLVHKTLDTLGISEVSPGWQNFLLEIEQMVTDGLRNSVLSTLRAMHVRCAMDPSALGQHEVNNDPSVPFFIVQLVLEGSEPQFYPPLVEDGYETSLSEIITQWVNSFLDRTLLMMPLTSQVDYSKVIREDREILDCINSIQLLADKVLEQCMDYVHIFEPYRFLWTQDATEAFSAFVSGSLNRRPRPISRAEAMRSRASVQSAKSSHSSIRPQSSLESAGLLGLTEKRFLQSTGTDILSATTEDREQKVPSLDEFEAELSVFKVSLSYFVVSFNKTVSETRNMQVNSISHIKYL